MVADGTDTFTVMGLALPRARTNRPGVVTRRGRQRRRGRCARNSRCLHRTPGCAVDPVAGRRPERWGGRGEPSAAGRDRTEQRSTVDVLRACRTPAPAPVSSSARHTRRKTRRTPGSPETGRHDVLGPRTLHGSATALLGASFLPSLPAFSPLPPSPERAARGRAGPPRHRRAAGARPAQDRPVVLHHRRRRPMAQRSAAPGRLTGRTRPRWTPPLAWPRSSCSPPAARQRRQASRPRDGVRGRFRRRSRPRTTHKRPAATRR